MADVPAISPSPPPVPVSGTAPVAPVAPPAAAPQLTLADVPVQQAPAALTLPDVPVIVQGTVIASDPQAQQIRIQTALGEVAVQSAAPIPPETPVTVEVFTDKNQTLATITVLQQAINATQPPEQIVAPPPLQEGQTVTAVPLPPAAPSPTIEQLAIQSPHPNPLPEGEGTKRNFFLPPLPLGEGRGEGTSSSAPKSLTQNTPPPTLIQKLLSAYLPARAPAPAPPEPAVPEIIDNNLLNIMRAQLHAKATQQTIQSPVPPPEKSAATAPPVPEHLDALLSFAENLPPQKIPLPSMPPLPPNMVGLKIIKILPPDTPPEQVKTALQKIVAAQNPQEPLPKIAEVESVTTHGAPVLKIGEDHFVVTTPVTVPSGSFVIIEASPLTPEQIMAGLQPTPAAKPFDPLLGNSWPTLHEAMQVILQSAPAAVAQAFRNTLPTPTQNLVPTALFFLAALRLGAVENWLGENTLKVLRESGKKDLPGRIADDFGKISSQSKETLPDDWHSISMPLLHDDQLSQMQFWVRRQYEREDGNKDDGQKPATRFILNLHLSRMGEMQLDGFIQKKKFDVVLRTEEKLPFDMRQELMKRFAQGLDQVQMQGGISFQGKRQGWVSLELPHQAGVVT